MQLRFFVNSSSCPKRPDLHQLCLKIKLCPSTGSASSSQSWGENLSPLEKPWLFGQAVLQSLAKSLIAKLPTH